MRYVRFWRGSADDFARITHKNEDTMYFVIQPDTNSFTMYLGATELLSGDDLNSSSIDALEDVIISKKLYDRQVLMYDALQECWVNASLDKAAGAYVGPTAEYMGLPGMLPGAPAGSENLFFRSDGKWVEQHIEKFENISNDEHTNLIAQIAASWDEINKNDLIIISEKINDIKCETAYFYNGIEWLSINNNDLANVLVPKVKKFENELDKRPIAYSAVISEIHKNMRFTSQEEFDAFLAETEHVSLGSEYVDKNSWSKFYLVKIYDRFLEQEDFLKGSWYFSDGTSDCLIQELFPSYNQINHGYCVNVSNTNIIASLFENTQANEIFSGNIKDEDVLTPGIWAKIFFEYSYGEYRTICIVETQFTATVDPGKKIAADLIDAEWMATSTLKDLEIIVSNENADEFEIFDHGGDTPGTKLSDVVPTREQLIGSTISITHLDGSVENILLSADDIQMPENGFPWYGVLDTLAIASKEITIELNDGGTATFPKGIFLFIPISDMLQAFNASSIVLCVPNVLPAVTPLPEKFLSDKVVQAWKPIREEIAFDSGLIIDGQYPTEEMFSEFLKDKNYFDVDDGSWIYYVKLSNVTPTEEEVKAGKMSWDNQLEPKSIDTLEVIKSKDFDPSAPNFLYIENGKVIIAYENITQGSLSITTGTWVCYVEDSPQLSGAEEWSVGGVWSLSIPSVTIDPGKKIDPELIDAEWLATETQSDLDITISNENADSFELFAGMIPKLSDYAPTIEQLKTSTFTVVLLDGTVQEIQITDDMIYHDETVPSDVYIVNNFLIIIGSEMTMEGITLSKGTYLGGPVSDVLSEMQLSSGTLHVPNAIRQTNLLPEKYLPNTVVQAYKKEGYFPLDIEWDGEIGDRETSLSSDKVSVFVKVSDLCDFTKEQLLTSTITVTLGISSDLIVEEKAYGYELCLPIQWEGTTSSFTLVSVVHTPNDDFKSTGIYFVKTDLLNIGYVSNLHIQSYYQTITKKIDPELVDMDWYAGKTINNGLELTFVSDAADYETITMPIDWGDYGTGSFTLVKLSNITPTIEELQQGIITAHSSSLPFDGTPTPIINLLAQYPEACRLIEQQTGDTNIFLFTILFPFIIVLPEDGTLGVDYDNKFHTKGIYMALVDDDSEPSHLYIPSVEDARELVKLPEKYLPDTISLPDMSRYATKDELAALAAQISAINIALQNRLEGVE